MANAHFGGDGPFWGNGARADVPGLPRRKPALPEGLTEFRQTELLPARRACIRNPAGNWPARARSGRRTWWACRCWRGCARGLPGRLPSGRSRPPTPPSCWSKPIPRWSTTRCARATRHRARRGTGHVAGAGGAGGGAGGHPARAVHRPPRLQTLPEEGWIFGLGHGAELAAPWQAKHNGHSASWPYAQMQSRIHCSSHRSTVSGPAAFASSQPDCR